MRFILIAWALPLGFFWGWYFLSLNDISFGFLMLSRQVHDLYFEIAGHIMGIEPATVPGLVARACIVDTGLLLAIWAFRRRRELAARFRELRARYSGAEESSPSA